MKTEQSRKHRNKFHLGSLAISVIILLLVASTVHADSTSSVITLISVSVNTDPDTGSPMASAGNSTFSSVTYDGKNVAFDSNAKDLPESNVNTSSTDIFLSVDTVDSQGADVKWIHRIAGSDGSALDMQKCAKAPDRCNSSFPVISRFNQADNGLSSHTTTYDIVFSSSATLVMDGPNGQSGLSGSCTMFGYNCKSIFLAKVDLNNPSNLNKYPIQRVSVGINNQAENGNSGYQDFSLITPINVLHPVAGVYESKGALDKDGKPVADINGAMAGDAVVVFESDASNLVSHLVPGETDDKNTHKDIFLRDMGDPTAGVDPSPAVRLTNKGYDNKEPNGDSSNPVITDDGKYMAFVSTATNLVAGVSSNIPQVYLLDLVHKTFYLVSNNSGHPGDGESRYPSITDSTDGSVVRVAFHSTSKNLSSESKNGIANIYVYTLTDPGGAELTETLDLISRGSSANLNNNGPVGDMDSLTPFLTSNGGAVAFSSYADNLVEGANNYDCPAITLHGQLVTKCKDIYVTDLSSNQTWRVSLTASGDQAQSNSAFPALSGDGKLISFTSYVDIFGTGGQDYHMQIYQRDQGVPLGNPNVQPSSWSFYAQANQTSIRTFTITSLKDPDPNHAPPIPATILGNETYAGLTLTGDDAGSFTIPEITNSCKPGIELRKGQSCTFTIVFTASDMNAKSAVLKVPINDVRVAIDVALQGRTIVSYLPFFQLH